MAAANRHASRIDDHQVPHGRFRARASRTPHHARPRSYPACKGHMTDPFPAHESEPDAVEARHAAYRIAFGPVVFQARRALRDLGVLRGLHGHRHGITLTEPQTATGLSRSSTIVFGPSTVSSVCRPRTCSRHSSRCPVADHGKAVQSLDRTDRIAGVRTHDGPSAECRHKNFRQPCG